MLLEIKSQNSSSVLLQRILHWRPLKQQDLGIG